MQRMALISGYRVLECDDNGNYVSDTQYDSEWNVTSYTTDYQYDADGNLLQCTEYNGDGTVSKKMVYYQQNVGDTFWKVRWYDADGNLTFDSGAIGLNLEGEHYVQDETMPLLWQADRHGGDRHEIQGGIRESVSYLPEVP